MEKVTTITISVVEDADAPGGARIELTPDDTFKDPNGTPQTDPQGRLKARGKKHGKIIWKGDETVRDCRWVVGIKQLAKNPFWNDHLATAIGAGSAGLKVKGSVEHGEEYPYFVFVARQSDDGPALFADPIIVIDNGPGLHDGTRLSSEFEDVKDRLASKLKKLRKEVSEEFEEIGEEIEEIFKRRR